MIEVNENTPFAILHTPNIFESMRVLARAKGVFAFYYVHIFNIVGRSRLVSRGLRLFPSQILN